MTIKRGSFLAAGALALTVAVIASQKQPPAPAEPTPAVQSLEAKLTSGFFQHGDSARAVLSTVVVDVQRDGRTEIRSTSGHFSVRADVGEATTPLVFNAAEDAVTLPRGVVLERWIARNDTVEQQWELAARPAGEGDFTVRLALNGATVQSVDEDGVTLSAGVRYGHATWVDSRGARTRVPARQEGHGVIAYVVPRELLSRSSYPAVLDPIISAVQQVNSDSSTSVVLENGNEYPQIAIAGNSALVVWRDDRRRQVSGSGMDVYGAIVTFPGSGIVIQQRFLIDASPGDQGGSGNPPELSVATGGNEFLVVYSTSDGADRDLVGAFIPIPPTVVTSRPEVFRLRATANIEATSAVAWSPTESRFLVVYDSAAGLGPLQGVRVDPAAPAASRVSSPFVVGDSAGFESRPSVAWSGTQYVIAWLDTSGAGSTAFMSRVQQNATTASAPVQLGSTGSETDPEVIAGGGQHLVVWTDFRATPGALYGTMVNSAGGANAAGTLIRGSTATGNVTSAQGTYNPAGLNPAFGIMALEVLPSIHWSLFWVNSALAPVNTVTSVGTGLNGNDVAVNNNFFGLAAYSDGTDVYLVRLTNQAFTTDVVPLGALPQQEELNVATMGSRALVAWQEWNGLDSGFDLYVGRFEFDGGAVDPAGIQVRSALPFNTNMHMGASANEAFLLYTSPGLRGNVSANRVSSAGAVGATFDLAAASNTEVASSVVYDGTNFALHYLHATALSGVQRTNILFGRRVNPAGTFVDPANYVVHARGATADVIRGSAGAANSSGVVLMVADYALQTESLYRTIVTNGVSSDSTGATGLIVNNGGFPSVASNGTQFVVVWEDHRAGTSPDIYAQRFDATGAAVDASPVAIEVGNARSSRPNVTFNGQHYLITWHEDANDAGTDLRGRWYSQTLQSLYDLTAPVSGDDDFVPHAASNGQGVSLVAFAKATETGATFVPRLHAITATAGQPGEACTSNAQCFAGFCVDGFCCNNACAGGCETCAAANGAPANGTCGARTAGAVCRISDGGCDAVETCDGTQTQCPADGVQPNTFVCRPAVADCDVAETCAGTKACPADAIADAGTVCSNSGLPCALPAACTGASTACPVAGVRPADFLCRAKSGDCDVEEKCDGVQQTCPADGLAPSSVVCRQSTGECDSQETCSGNDALCPADQFVPNTTICREANGVCDAPEYCSGNASSCPSNAFAPATQVCGEQVAGDECDAPDVCSGTEAFCGANLKKPDGTVCANGAGVCEAGACRSLNRSRYGWEKCGCSAGGGTFALLALAVLLLRRRRVMGAGMFLAALLFVSTTAEAAPLKLIFTGVAPGNGVSDETSKSVGEYVEGELAGIPNYNVVSQSDIQAILGLERQKQLMGCGEESSCVAELTGALDADRLLRSEMSRLDETIIINFALTDARAGKPISRVTRRIETGGVSAALREVRPMLYELLNSAPENKEAPLVYDRGFGGFVVGLRGDADVIGLGVVPAVSAEVSSSLIGGALTVIAGPNPGVRLEGRFYPLSFKSVRPFVSVGGTALSTGVAARGGAGAAVRFGQFQVSADAAYEQYLVDFEPGFASNAVMLGVGLGWQI